MEYDLDHCYEFTLANTDSGEFLASHMLDQASNRTIDRLKEQEWKKINPKKNYAETSMETTPYLFLHNYNNVPKCVTLKTPRNQLL